MGRYVDGSVPADGSQVSNRQSYESLKKQSEEMRQRVNFTGQKENWAWRKRGLKLSAVSLGRLRELRSLDARALNRKIQA